MKTFVLVFFVSLATAYGVGDASSVSAPNSVAGFMEEKFKDEFKFDSKVSSNVLSEASTPSTEEKVFVLTKYVVRPLSQYGLLELSFMQQKQALKDKVFTNNEGGTIFETKWGRAKVEYKFKYNPSRNLMDILNISW